MSQVSLFYTYWFVFYKQIETVLLWNTVYVCREHFICNVCNLIFVFIWNIRISYIQSPHHTLTYFYQIRTKLEY